MSTQNTNGKIQLSTNSLTFFDESGVMLRCSFLDEAISIQMCIPTIENEKRTYPKETRENLLLTKDRVSALHDLIYNKVLPAIDGKTNYNGGVFTSIKKDNIFEITTQNGEVFATFHKDIDGNRHPKNSIVFKFGLTPVIERFNPSSGDFEINEIHAQFALFVKMLDAFTSIAVNNSVAHSIRNSNKFVTDKILSQLFEIGTKLGINTNTGSQSGFLDATPTNTPPIQEMSSLEGMLN